MEEITSKIGSGSTPRGSNYSVDGIPFFRSQNVYNDGLRYDDIKYISNDVHNSMIATAVHSNDLLLNITGGSIGRCAVVPQDFITGNVSQHVCIIRPVLCDPQYIHAYIISDLFWESMELTGSGREGLPKYNLEQMLLPLPPYKEQLRIISELNILETIIENIGQSIIELTNDVELTKSKILDLAMQGKLVERDTSYEPAADMLRRITPKAKIITDNPHYPQLPDNWVYISIADLNEYKSTSVNPLSTPSLRFELYSVPTFASGAPEYVKGKDIGSTKQSVQKGDVLLCKINPHLNRVWDVTNDSTDTQIASSEWIVIRSAILQPLFLRYYLSSPKFRDLLCSQVSGVGGSLTRAQPAIVKNYLVPVPPIQEQNRIAERIKVYLDLLVKIEEFIELELVHQAD